MQARGSDRSLARAASEDKTDQQLMDDVLSGHSGAALLMAEWARQVAVHRVWGFDSAEDIVQSTMVILVRNLREGKVQRDNLKAYVRRIAKNLCISSYRKARVRRCTVSLEIEPAAAKVGLDIPTDTTGLMTLRWALDQLEEACREIITLAYESGLSRREIAAKLGIGESAAKVRLFRCLKKARDLVCAE